MNNSILNTLNSNSLNQNNFGNKNKNSNLNYKKIISLPTKLNHESSNDNSMICNDSNINNQTWRETIINKNSNFFSNLSITKAKSFQLNFSYENLNEITKNKYIKDNNLQTKTKQFLLNECSITNYDSLKGKNLLLLKNSFEEKNLSTDKNIKNLASQFDLEQDKRSVNSLDLPNLKSNRDHKNSNDSKYELEKIKKEKTSETIKNNSYKNIISHKQSMKNINDSPSSKFKCKSPKKKKNIELGVNKKLNIISQNIRGASKNINNPDEFYMDFFNNIIKQRASTAFKLENKNNNIDKSKDKTNQLNYLGKNMNSTKKYINSIDILSDLNQKNQGKIK